MKQRKGNIMKHTPAPWEIRDKNCNPYIEKDGYEICQLFRTAFLNDDYTEDIEFENAQANARLIAAAPELLEALDSLYASLMFNDVLKTHPKVNEAMIMANSAIAKAKGE